MFHTLFSDRSEINPHLRNDSDLFISHINGQFLFKEA